METAIGVIGLGIMGGAFARHLAQGGRRVIGFDTDAARRAEAQAAGVEIAHSAEAVAEAARDIILSLPTARAVLDTAQIIAGVTAGRCTVIEASTLSLEDKREFQRILAKGGHIALDCPVSGSGAHAARKDIVIYASGDAQAIKRVEPVLLGFSRQVYDLGEFGNGSKMKFVANHLVAIHTVAAAEAMVLAIKAGLDPQRVVEVIGAGAGGSRIFDVRAPMMAKNSYLPATMRSATWKKDLTVIGGFAASMDCPTPLFAASEPLYAAALAMGHGAEDMGAVCAVLEKMAGVKR
jgi:putative dehydrogenase